MLEGDFRGGLELEELTATLGGEVHLDDARSYFECFSPQPVEPDEWDIASLAASFLTGRPDLRADSMGRCQSTSWVVQITAVRTTVVEPPPASD